MRYLAIRRDDRFSPNAVENDRAILRRASERLRELLGLADDIEMVDERQWVERPMEADVYLSMAREETTLGLLRDKESGGNLVVNGAQGVLRCRRTVLDQLMRLHHVPMPPLVGSHGYWLKRGDAAAQSKADVVFCEDLTALNAAKEAFRKRGVTDMVVSAHVPGDLVKFYGVGTAFFQFFYPSDDGISKFGDEKRNGVAHHYAFEAERLHQEVVRLSQLVGVEVFGGDAIIDEHGRFYIIDFNDWPSFSRCREEAAMAIAQCVAKARR